MTYATQDDIVTLYSEDALLVADRDHSGAADPEVVSKALVFATAEINASLAARYPMPIPGTHDILTQLAVDIALYRMASASDVMTEEHRTRYEDATKMLKAFAHGEKKLTLPEPPDNPDGTPGDPGSQSVTGIVTGGPEREFTREKMRGF